MKRRNFIALTALTTATVGLPFLSCRTANPELDKKLAVPQTLSQLLDEPGIRAIGKAFPTINTDEYSVRKLEDLLSENRAGETVSSNTPSKDIYAMLEQKIQSDFESGNTIVLNGWVLALTEARQCALFSLISNRN